jgi:hypothetical protein
MPRKRRLVPTLSWETVVAQGLVDTVRVARDAHHATIDANGLTRVPTGLFPAQPGSDR